MGRNMDCSKTQRLAQDLADGRLSDRLARELQRHLTECTDCRVAQQRAGRLQQLLALKRHEHPGTDYFDGFLGNFHQRLAVETAPQPNFWERMVAVFHIQNVPTLRFGFAHACGIVFACGMIVRGLITTDIDSDVSRVDALSVNVPHLPAPHSQPRRIALTLPRPPEPVSSTSSDLILPVAPRDEPAVPRYVLDRISLSSASYEVAKVDF